MRALYADYGIQAMVFPWVHHGARYLRIYAALYNAEEEYRYIE